ncbi:hypothetical protein HZA38_00870 [Candidatus Peregrinibacteria bacterium]|nr:hypothetical protein [Candidatus Peregrinibacteria bacterium]
MNTRFFSRNVLLVGTALLLAVVAHAGLLPATKALAAIDVPRVDIAPSSDLKTAVIGFINYFLGFLGLVAVAFVIYAGVLMVTSQGEDESTGKAKKILLWSGVGIIIIMLSYAIVQLVVRAGETIA